MRRISQISLIVFILTFSCNQNKNQEQVIHQFTRCNHIENNSRVSCAMMEVPENRKTGKGQKIELHVIQIRALDKDSLLDPIFYFEGGPGVAASNSADFFGDSTNPYRKRHDIILVDVRGTGYSNPLHCLSLQVKNNLEEQYSEMYPTEAVRSCYDSLSKDADLSQYTTENIAKDIDEVRKTLGYTKISLFGLSYGTRLAQVYIKLFPHTVESAVLWSAATIDTRMPLYHARFAEDAIEKIFDDCKRDPACNSAFPSLPEDFASLVKNNQAGFRYTYPSGGKDMLTIPWHAFQTKLRSSMYTSAGTRSIPFLIHSASKGNFAPFLSLFPKGKDTSFFLADGLYLCITCTEDVPFIDKKMSDSLTKGTFMGDYRINQQKQACANWIKNVMTVDRSSPKNETIPVLILAGEFDPVTPVSMAKQIAGNYAKSRLVIIPYMAHTFDGLSNEICFDRMVVEFLDSPSHPMPDTKCVAQMLPPPYQITDQEN